jgi:hypothetical protein
MVLPESGPTTGEYKVALFGLNFVAGSKFKIKFGSFPVKRIKVRARAIGEKREGRERGEHNE